MSDQLVEQQPQQPPDPSAWGQPISDERKVELDALFERQRAWAEQPMTTRSASVFQGVRLTGAEVFWLAIRAIVGLDAMPEAINEAVRVLQSTESVERLSLDLSTLHLEGANLGVARLERANLFVAHLERANLGGAHLKGARLYKAHLKGTRFYQANLERANLYNADLEDADLYQAHLERAVFVEAHLERAVLRQAHLDGANLWKAHLEGTDLRRCWFDSDTLLSEVTLNDRTSLGEIKWRDADLTTIPWDRMRRLGDERGVGLRASADDHREVVRAYRHLAAQLRAQGLADVADRFSYRAQIRMRYTYLRTLIEDWRHPWRWPIDLLRYLGSAALALLAGYGYRPGRTIILYLVFITCFATLFFAYGTGCHISGPQDIALILAQQITHAPQGYACATPPAQPMSWNEAFVVSLTAFHGRGFLATDIKPSDPQAALAAAEAVLGLIIEISFIATFTQRFFGAK